MMKIDATVQSCARSLAQQAADRLPAHLASVVWPAHQMGSGPQQVWPSGHQALDAELPGGGWPAQALTEIMQEQPGLAEWRLLLPALREVTAAGGHVLLIGPPHVPHLPGLAQQGLPAERVIRIDASAPAERLWATEQALLANGLWAILSWLPQARAEQVRRLQVCSGRQAGPTFLFRPTRVMTEASAAPLRLQLTLGPCPHPLLVRIVKRRGPFRESPLLLPSWAPDLIRLLPPSPAEAAPALSTRTTAKPLPAHLGTPDHVELDRPAARSIL